MSTLLGRLFSNIQYRTRTIFVTQNSTPSYNEDTTRVTNVDITRGMYHNTLNKYALAGQLCKPIINANVSFIGTPKIKSESQDTKEFLESLDTPYEETHRMAERDADVWVWPQWNHEEQRINMEIIPPEKIYKEFIDPNTKEVLGYTIRETVRYNDLATDDTKEITIYCKVTKDKITKWMDTGVKNVYDNPFGIIPIVQFSNNRENSHESRGHSELENVEPQLKYYHDLMFEAGNAQKRAGQPILVQETKNVEKWVDNNFGTGKFASLQAGTGELDLTNRKMIVNGEDEKTSFISNNAPIGDALPLANVQFKNIVEGSETPEVQFGANLGTSLASVKEQRPVWIKKIEGKQKNYGKSWMKVFDISIAIINYVQFKNLSFDYDIIWDVPDFKDEKETAEILKTVSEIMQKMKTANIMSDEEIHSTLSRYKTLKLTENFVKHNAEIDDTAKQSALRQIDTETLKILEEAGVASKEDEE